MAKGNSILAKASFEVAKGNSILAEGSFEVARRSFIIADTRFCTTHKDKAYLLCYSNMHKKGLPLMKGLLFY